VSLTKTSPQRNLNDLDQPMTCIFNDIIRLDFTKYKQVLGEYTIYMREREAQEQADYEERKRAQEEAEANVEIPEKGKPPNSSLS